MKNLFKEVYLAKDVIDNVYINTKRVDALNGIKLENESSGTLISFQVKLLRAPK
jgi:hypothetical protein